MDRSDLVLLEDAGPGHATVYAQLESENKHVLRERLNVLYRRRWWALGTFVLVLGVGIWLTNRATPLYEAVTTLRIDVPQSQSPLLSDAASLQPQNSIETEMQMLKSRALAEEVVRRLGLNVRLVVPPVARNAVVDSAAVTGAVEPGRYVLRGENGAWSVRRGDQLLARADAGQGLAFAGVQVWLKNPAPHSNFVLGITPPAAAASALASGINVSIPVMYSNFVRVAYRSSEPKEAGAIVNALASEYIARSSRSAKTEARSRREFLETQLAQLARELTKNETELNAFKEEARVYALETEAVHGVTTYADLQAERDRNAAERNALAALLNESADGEKPSTLDIAAFPTFMENDAIQRLREQLNELEAKRDLLLVENTPAHPDVVALDRQIGQIRGRLNAAAQSYQKALDAKIGALNQTLAGSRGKLRDLPEKELRLAQLTRARKITEELYTQLQIRLKEAQLDEAADEALIRVIDPALTPTAPVAPNKRRNLILAALVGLVLGCGVAFGRNYFDNTFRTKEHLQSELPLPLVGLIPPLHADARKSLPKSAGRGAAREPSGNGRPVDPLLLTQFAFSSPAMEAFRALRTNLSLIPAKKDGRHGRLILVTSPGPGDGKTVIASNLAVSFAQQGKKTILIDADLRRGIQHRRFGIDADHGLADYLLDRVVLEEVVRRTTTPNLYLLPAGSYPPLPTELLSTAKMEHLITILASQIDVVIFDSPPVLPVADATVLSSKVDDVLLVIRAGVTHKRAAADALTLVSNSPGIRVTCVMNGLNYEDLYGRSYYGQYYGGYYGGRLTEGLVLDSHASERGLDREDSIVDRAPDTSAATADARQNPA